MANWFKIYETDLDEKRLKYALGQLPEVGWVWVNILAECCKHRSDTIRYSQNEIDLYGFSDAIKVSIPKINEAILLLAKIEYIEILDGKIRVIKWDTKQSEYNRRRSRGDYRIISDNIGDSPQHRGEYPLEERRGEEKRTEENIIPPPPTRDAAIPTWEEVKQEADMRGVTEASAKAFYDHHEGNSIWLNEHGKLKNWKHKLKVWGENDRQPKPKTHETNRQPAPSRNAGTYNAGPVSAGLKAKVL